MLALYPMLVMVVGIVSCQLVFGANKHRTWCVCVFVCVCVLVLEVSGVRGDEMKAMIKEKACRGEEAGEVRWGKGEIYQ